MKIVVVGDVGVVEGIMHVGDEAMTEAVIDALSARAVDSIVLVSADPVDSASRYGVKAIPRIGFDATFTPDRASRDTRLDSVVSAARGTVGALESHDQAWDVIRHVADSDGIVVAGGGNLSSLWPEHVYERAALARIAGVFARPVVFSGQTLGPALTGPDGELLAEMLKSAAAVGLRDASSVTLFARLGVPAELARPVLDDALFIGGESSAIVPEREYCIVTVAEYGGDIEPELFRRAMAGFLDSVIDETGLHVLLVPHLGSIRAGVLLHDQLSHADIVSGMKHSSDVTQTPVLRAREVADLTRKAALSISTRYHPLVFALSGATPAVAIAVDEYTLAKLTGAQANLGMTEFVVPSISLASGDALAVVREVWSARAEITAHLEVVASVARSQAEQWWDDMVNALETGELLQRQNVTMPHFSVIEEDLAGRIAKLSEWQSSQTSEFTAQRINWGERVDTEAARQEEIIELECRLGAVSAELESADQRWADTEHALASARALVSELAEPEFRGRIIDINPHSAARELDALMNTRLLRWTRMPRRVYAGLRRRSFGDRA